MNWKDFLDWRKILLTIILFALSTGPLFLPCATIAVVGAPALHPLCFLLVFSWLLFPIVSIVGTSIPLLYLFGLLEMYLLSWIIVWLIDKIKRKS